MGDVFAHCEYCSNSLRGRRRIDEEVDSIEIREKWGSVTATPLIRMTEAEGTQPGEQVLTNSNPSTMVRHVTGQRVLDCATELDGIRLPPLVALPTSMGIANKCIHILSDELSSQLPHSIRLLGGQLLQCTELESTAQALAFRHLLHADLSSQQTKCRVILEQ